MKRKGIFPMWDSKPKKITSAILGLEAKIAPTIKMIFLAYSPTLERHLSSFYLIRHEPMELE